MNGPRILLLDGDAFISLSIARELSEDLGATIIAVGTTRFSRTHRSKHCDVAVVAPSVNDARYTDAVLDLIETYRPDFVLPVGYRSAAKLELARADLPASVSTCLPSLESFRTAADKMATSRCGAAVGLDTPSDYTSLAQELDEAGRPADRLSELDFPLFLKPRWETGGGHAATSSVEDPTRFWETYDRVAKGAPGGDVLVQEKIDGPSATYGCGLLFLDDKLELLFSHEERRSVPRRGGSGTHLRIVRDPHLEAKSIELLREIDWHGLALVEFKKRTDGSYVLMEINPKFWASYALASTHGYRFASTMVARSLGLETEPPIGSPVPVGEMVFPLRELHFYAQHYREESLRECLATILRPGVSWSVDRTDLLAWLTPPASVIQKLPTVDELSSGETVPKPLSDDVVDETNEVETSETS